MLISTFATCMQISKKIKQDAIQLFISIPNRILNNKEILKFSRKTNLLDILIKLLTNPNLLSVKKKPKNLLAKALFIYLTEKST